MSDIELEQIHKFFRVTISSIKFTKTTDSGVISSHAYNNSPFKITLPLGLLGYCQTIATISPIKGRIFRVNNILQLLDICQAPIIKKELSIIAIRNKT